MGDRLEGAVDGRQKDDRLQAVGVVARLEGVACMVDRRLPVGVRLEGVGCRDGRQMADGHLLVDHQRDVADDRHMVDHQPVEAGDRRTDDHQPVVVGGHPLVGHQQVVVGDPRTGGHRLGVVLMHQRFEVGDSLGPVGTQRVVKLQDVVSRRCRFPLLEVYHHWLHTRADAACRSKIVAFAILRVGGC